MNFTGTTAAPPSTTYIQLDSLVVNNTLAPYTVTRIVGSLQYFSPSTAGGAVLHFEPAFGVLVVPQDEYASAAAGVALTQPPTLFPVTGNRTRSWMYTKYDLHVVPVGYTNELSWTHDFDIRVHRKLQESDVLMGQVQVPAGGNAVGWTIEGRILVTWP